MAQWIDYNNHNKKMSSLSYPDKLAHIQVINNCRYFVAQMCTPEDTLAHNLGAPYIDDAMSYNSLTTMVCNNCALKKQTKLSPVLSPFKFQMSNII